MKHRCCFIFLLLITAFVFSEPIDHQIIQFVIAKNRIAEEGKALIVFTNVFDFSVYTKDTISFEIPAPNFDNITIVNVIIDKIALAQDEMNKSFTFFKDTNTVNFKIPKNLTGVHELTVTYAIEGFTSKNIDHDEILFHATSMNQPHFILKLTIGCGFPSNEYLLNNPVISVKNSELITIENGFLFTCTNISPKTKIDVSIPLQKNLITSIKPKWQIYNDNVKKYFVFCILISVLLVFLGIIIAIILKHNSNKKISSIKKKSITNDENQEEQNSILQSALCSFGLYVSSDFALGALLSCVRKGLVTIKDAKNLKSDEHDFLFEKTNSNVDKSAIDDAILNVIFDDSAKTEHLNVWLSDFKKNHTQFDIIINSMLLDKNLIQKDYLKVRKQKMKITLLFVLLCAITTPILFMILYPTGLWPFGFISIGFMLSAIIVFSTETSIVPYTKSGLIAKSKAKQKYYNLLDLLKKPHSITQKQYDENFEYAAAFGILSPWVSLPYANSNLEYPEWLGAIAKAKDTNAADALEKTAREADKDVIIE